MKTKKDKFTDIMQKTFFGINTVLYTIDPLHTACGSNEGMEDEYLDVVDVLYRMFQDETLDIREFTAGDIIKALSECFGVGLVEDVCEAEVITECTRRINECLRIFFDELKGIEEGTS